MRSASIRTYTPKCLQVLHYTNTMFKQEHFVCTRAVIEIHFFQWRTAHPELIYGWLALSRLFKRCVTHAALAFNLIFHCSIFSQTCLPCESHMPAMPLPTYCDDQLRHILYDRDLSSLVRVQLLHAQMSTRNWCKVENSDRKSRMYWKNKLGINRPGNLSFGSSKKGRDNTNIVEVYRLYIKKKHLINAN